MSYSRISKTTPFNNAGNSNMEFIVWDVKNKELVSGFRFYYCGGYDYFSRNPNYIVIFLKGKELNE